MGIGSGKKLAEVVRKNIGMDEHITMIDISLIQLNPHNIRQSYETENIELMAHSIMSQGLLQAIGIYKLDAEQEDGTLYRVIFGNTRFLAWKQLVANKTYGIESKIPCKIFTKKNNYELMMIENLRRNSLTQEETEACIAEYAHIQLDKGIAITQIIKSIGLSKAQYYRAIHAYEIRKICINAQIDSAHLGTSILEEMYQLFKNKDLDISFICSAVKKSINHSGNKIEWIKNYYEQYYTAIMDDDLQIFYNDAANSTEDPELDTSIFNHDIPLVSSHTNELKNIAKKKPLKKIGVAKCPCCKKEAIIFEDGGKIMISHNA